MVAYKEINQTNIRTRRNEKKKHNCVKNIKELNKHNIIYLTDSENKSKFFVSHN